MMPEKPSSSSYPQLLLDLSILYFYHNYMLMEICFLKTVT